MQRDTGSVTVLRRGMTGRVGGVGAVVGVAGLSVFVVIDRVFEPDRTAAAPAIHIAGGPMPEKTDERLSIGELRGPLYTVRICSGEFGPLYTVCTPEGDVLAEGLAADEVYREFPELDIDRMLLEPASGWLGDGLMMVDTGP